MEDSSLKPVFMAYSTGEMNGKTFVKVFNDAKMLDKKLTQTGLDIIFNKVKTKGKLKIDFTQFVDGIKHAAKEKNCEFDALVSKISQLKGPNFVGTKAQYTKFHDDKTTYTGVYKEGGPTTVDKGNGKIADLSDLANRKDANIRGVNKDIMKKSEK